MKSISVFLTMLGILSFFGFWIVAIIGAFLIFLPVGAFFFVIFPNTANRLQTSCGLAKFEAS